MVLWIICGVLATISVATWLYCLQDSTLDSMKIYILGKICLLLLIVVLVISKSVAFFVYNLEIQEVKIDQIARFNDGGKNKILAIVKIEDEKVAFEVGKTGFEKGDKLKIRRKSSKFPVYDNWSNDWELHK